MEYSVLRLPKDPPEKSAEKIDARFQKKLLLTRILHLQVPYQDQRKYKKYSHNDPGNHHGFENRYPVKDRNG